MKAAIQVLIGFVACMVSVWGFLMLWAGAMSDSPYEGAFYGKLGALLFLAGVILFALDAVAAFAMRPQKPGSRAP